MRFLKLGLISVIVIFLLMTLIGSLFPSQIVVQRAKNIDVPADSLKKFINDYNLWNDWMDGAKNSDMKVTSKDSAHAYFGTVVITLLSKQNNEWKHDWKSRTFSQISTIKITALNPSECTIAWDFEQHVNWYPWAKIGSMMNEKIIGSSLEKSLDNLKVLAEKN